MIVGTLIKEIGYATNVNQRTCNQRISLNSLGTTPSPGIDKNNTQEVLYAHVHDNLLYNVNKYESPN